MSSATARIDGMKTEIHPEYVLSHVHCSCGNQFYENVMGKVL